MGTKESEIFAQKMGNAQEQQERDFHEAICIKAIEMPAYESDRKK
jgi:hypothetical protein